MTTFLETLKIRLVEAQQQHAEASTKFQRAQAEFQAATQRLQSWQIAVNAEIQREQAQNPSSPTPQPQSVVPGGTVSVVITTDDGTSSSSISKAEIIRQQLRQHPAGMTGGELWTAVKNQIRNRPYVYSVLKRLRDKDEVIFKKKKYRLVPKPGEDVGQTVQ